jgi:hypothetical protein
MAAKQIVQEWVGANGLIYYGDTLLFVDDYQVQIVSDSIDITNISIYPSSNPLPPPEDALGATGQLNLPFPDNLPDTDLPFQKKSTNDIPRKQTQYGAGRLNIDGGLRVANITCSGLCATYNEDFRENYIPRINNYCYIQFSNTINPDITVFNFPIVLIKEVSFSYNVKNYLRWTLTGITTGEFDVFPGLQPV